MNPMKFLIPVSLFINSPELFFHVISLTKDENLCIPTQPVNTGEEYCGILNPVLIYVAVLIYVLNLFSETLGIQGTRKSTA